MRGSIGFLAVSVVIIGAAIAAGQSTPNRRIGRDSRYAIASQLRSDDRHVILEYNGTPPLVLAGPPKGGSRLEWLAKQSNVIVVVEVESIDSVLVYRDLQWREREAPADEANWIVSTVQARIDGVIKGVDELGKAMGDRLLLKAEGGTAMIRGTIVEAVVPWEVAMVRGKRYLLFGRMYNGQFVKNYGYEESSAGLLSRMTRPEPDSLGRLQMRDADDTEQWNIEQAAWLIREALR
jgi:hypothetical protein